MIRSLYIILVTVFFAAPSFQVRADEGLRYEFLLSPIPPLVMSDREAVQKGLLWDIAQRVLDQLATKGECDCKGLPTLLPWSRAVNVMANEPGKFMLQMARTPEREDLYDWIMPISQITFAFVTQETEAPNTIEEARALKRIAVYRGSRLEKFLRSKGFDRTLILANDSIASARLLNHGRVDAWYASVDEALWLHKRNLLALTPRIGTPIITVPVWLIASKGTPKAKQDAIKSLLQEMMHDGTIDAFQASYGLDVKTIN